MFVAAILIGNVLAAKQIGVGTFGTPAGILVFPLSYVMSDVVAEVYGFKAMRRIIWIGFAFTLLQAVLMGLASVLPAPVWYQNSHAFAIIAGLAPRIFLGQVLAYLVGEWANATIISSDLIFSCFSLFLSITASIPCGFTTPVIDSNTLFVTYIHSYLAISYICSLDILLVFSQSSHIIICLIWHFSCIASSIIFMPSTIYSLLSSLYFLSFSFLMCFINSLSLLVITFI